MEVELAETNMSEEAVPGSPQQPQASTSTSHQIPTNTELVKMNEQENLILDLGVEMVDRERFEAKIMDEVDEVMKVEEEKRQSEMTIKELRNVCKTLEQIRTKLEKCQNALESACSTNRYRRSMTLMEEQEMLIAQKEEQIRIQKELLVILKSQGKDVNDLGFKLELAESDDITKAEPEVGLAEEKIEEEETEQQKKIRLGAMTAFGTELKFNENDNENGHYEQYMRDQAKLNQISESGKSHRPKKKKKKRKDNEKKEKPERNSEYGANGTDDSDWESSDNDEDRKRKRISNKALDDGDKDEYLYRLDKWQKSERKNGTDVDNSRAEQLEGGLKVPHKIWSKLYAYQKVCVQWLWELHQQKVGGVLGDEMGLGKTIQIIAFLASMSFSQRQVNHGNRFGPILIVCPTTVMHQWVKEFHKWWPIFRVAVLHESGSHQGSRDRLVRSITHAKGVLVTSYSAVLAHKNVLLENQFQYVILDEGHKIRNPDALITLAVKQFSTPHRIILSGSPLQNNLKELWSLFDFIYPGKLGTLPVFMQEFSVPITQGGYANATRVQVATAYKCATILRDTINPYLLRRMKNDVKEHICLPEKNEQVLFCNLTEEQREIYKNYIESGEIKNILDGRSQVFVGLINLRKICNHPDLFDGGPQHYGTNTSVGSYEDFDREKKFGDWKRSGKMIVIEALLKLWRKQEHRVLLFTQSRQMLSILEDFMLEHDYNYLKLDGNTSIGSRQPMIDKFNQNKDIFVFILTTKVGGLGVNLTGASRVVIFDPDWNPSTDTQARERAWRIGQDKQVTIYRLMTAGTIEEKIYHRQIFKQFLVNRVLKDPKQKRFFKANDLFELFTLSEGTSNRTETSAIFAGTNSDVQIKRRKKKKKEKNDEKERSVYNGEGASKPVKATSTKVVKDDIKNSLKRLYNDDDSGGKELTDKEKLRARIKSISQKIGGQSSSSIENSQERKIKRGRFEGQKISHLVKSRPYKAPPADEHDQNSKETSSDQDSYVLSKLFKKSGVHSAVQHDAIVDGEGDDYVLIEGEAERVAKEAVENLKRSRRECFRAEAGIPTWTGSNGVTAPRFGKKKGKVGSKFTDHDSESDNRLFSGKSVKKKMLSSSELLSKIKLRNRFNPQQEQSDENLFQPDGCKSQSEEMELLADIRNFIAFQASSDGRATTNELVERFSNRVPPKHSPLFKALLNQICDLVKSPNSTKGDGVWKLKPDFA